MSLQAEIRDVLNRRMEIGKEYHIQEIYDFFDSPDGKVKHNTRAALSNGKRKGQIEHFPHAREYHTRVQELTR